MRSLHINQSGFTLIEMMLAVMLMALLAGAVAMGFSQPLKSSRTVDAIEVVRSFDNMARQSAVASGSNARLVFDVAQNSLMLRDGAELTQLRSRISLPQGCRIDAVRIDEHLVSSSEAILDISPHGWSKTYAVHLLCPGSDRWLVFAGMTGQMTQVQNESEIPTYHAPPRHDAD